MATYLCKDGQVLGSGYTGVSIKEMAKAASVSQSTVSRALCNSPLVNTKTAQCTHHVADGRGPVPSVVGCGLATQGTRTTGLTAARVAVPLAETEQRVVGLARVWTTAPPPATLLSNRSTNWLVSVRSEEIALLDSCRGCPHVLHPDCLHSRPGQLGVAWPWLCWMCNRQQTDLRPSRAGATAGTSQPLTLNVIEKGESV